MPFGKKQLKKLRQAGRKPMKRILPKRHVHNMKYARTIKHYNTKGPREIRVYACTDLKCHYTENK